MLNNGPESYDGDERSWAERMYYRTGLLTFLVDSVNFLQLLVGPGADDLNERVLISAQPL